MTNYRYDTSSISSAISNQTLLQTLRPRTWAGPLREPVQRDRAPCRRPFRSPTRISRSSKSLASYAALQTLADLGDKHVIFAFCNPCYAATFARLTAVTVSSQTLPFVCSSAILPRS